VLSVGARRVNEKGEEGRSTLGVGEKAFCSWKLMKEDCFSSCTSMVPSVNFVAGVECSSTSVNDNLTIIFKDQSMKIILACAFQRFPAQFSSRTP
jgi:hypothetical protein